MFIPLRPIWYRYKQLRGDWREAQWLAIDLETNGMSRERDHILSMGWIPLSASGMRMEEARYHCIRTVQPLSQSAVIHGLRQEDVTDGQPLESVLLSLAEAVKGRVLVAHNIRFDWAFLSRAADRLGIELKPLALADTLGLEQGRLWQSGVAPTAGALSLSRCRLRHGLPTAASHHALSDALACAELFLAQAWKLAGARPLSAARLIFRSGSLFLKSHAGPRTETGPDNLAPRTPRSSGPEYTRHPPSVVD